METQVRVDDHSTPARRTVKSVVNSALNAIAAVGTPLLSLLSGLLAAGLILFSGYVLYDSFYTQERAKANGDLLQYKPSIVEMEEDEAPEDLKSLLAEVNEDYRAWLTVYDTGIDYPVMQGTDDLYYAYHDIHRETSLTGAIYLAAANQPDLSDPYNLIYGHHMDNGAMFGGLDLYRQESYFNAHREAILVAQSAAYDLYAFAVAETDAYQNRIYGTGNQMDEVLAFLGGNVADGETAGADWSQDTLTLFFDEAALDGAAKIVALSTCAAANTNGRLLVFFVARERDMTVTVDTTPDPEATPRPTVRPVKTSSEGEESFWEKLFGIFDPRGTGRRVWALVNLICLIVTIYLFVPLLHLSAKFSRPRLMKRLNETKGQLRLKRELSEDEVRDRTRLEQLVYEARLNNAQPDTDAAPGDIRADEFGAAVETLFYRADRFRRRFNLGMVLELIFAALALVVFILTENMRLPMVFIDRWTPLMILLMFIVWALDVRFIRYREKVMADEEEAERRRLAREAAEETKE